LSGSGEIEESVNILLPDLGVAEGLFNLLIQVDANQDIVEDFEENNLAVARFHLESGEILDFSADSLALAESEVTVGSPFNITLQVSNTALESVDNLRVEFFLNDAALNDGSVGMYLGSLPVTVPAAGSAVIDHQFILPEGVVLPDSDNLYQVMALIDPEQLYEEENEDNNLVFSTNSFLASAGAIDLTATLDNAPAQATWEQPLTLDVSVNNTGDIGAPPFFVDLFLSTDDQLDYADFYLNSQMIFTLEPGDDQNLTFDIILPGPLPTGAGDYYLLVDVDGGQSVIETDEDNLVSSLISITGTPDIAVFWDDAPTKSNFEQTITVIDRVENWGNAVVEADQFEIQYYLSADALVDQNDEFLGSRALTSLGLQGIETTETELILPVDGDEGLYYLLAVSEAVGAAVDEVPLNDTAVWPLEIISNGMPDLKASALSTAVEEADWGDAISLNNTIANVGTANAGEFTVTFYLSDNRSITSQDTVLGTRTITSLAAAGNNTTAKPLTLPEVNPFGEDGEFYLGMMVDSGGTVAETNDANNILVTTNPITIGNVITVDLIAALVQGPTLGEIGDETIEVYYEVFNAGSTNSAAYDIDFYLTQSGSIDANAIQLGAVTSDSLAAGAWATDTASLSWPVELNDANGQNFSVAMQVNALQDPEERTYENNAAIGFGEFLVVAPVQTDVAVTDADADDDAEWGDPVTIDYQLQATGEINASVTVAFYLSETAGSSAAYQLGQADIDLTGIQTYDGALTFALPDESPFGRDGQLYVLVQADPQNDIAEGDDDADVNNNLFATPIEISSGMADLVAMKISGVPTVGTGQTFDAYNELTNFGSLPTDDFYVYFYLTEGNTDVDIEEDIFLGMRQVASLEGGAVNWTISSLNMPASGIDNGQYYLAMFVDRFDDINEISEMNNIVFSTKTIQVYSASIEPDDAEPNNTTGTATAITFDTEGDTQGLANNIPDTLTLHDSQDLDYFTFTAPADATGQNSANGFARLNVTPFSAADSPDTLNVAVKVNDTSNSTSVGGADSDATLGGDEIFTTFGLIPGHTYSILVKPVGDSFGSYTMDLELGIGATGDDYESNDTAADAYYLGSADTTLSDDPDTLAPASMHSATDVDYYKFAVPATSTGRFTIDVDPDPGLDAILQIFDTDDNLLGSSDDGGADTTETLTVDGAVGGNYYAVVSAWAGSTGAYQMDLAFTRAQQPDGYESNNTTQTASLLTANVLTNLTIHNGDIDYYDLSSIAPLDAMSLEAYIYGAAGLDTDVTLYAIDDLDVASVIRTVNRNGVNGSETLKANIGDYSQQQLILAVGNHDDTTGTYSLELAYGYQDIGDFAEPNQQRTTAYTVSLNDLNRLNMTELTMHNAADRDYYSFFAPDNTDGTATITVIPDDEADALNVSLRLLDIQGTVLKATDATGAGETESLTLNSTTTPLVAGEKYYIDVNGWGTLGEYELSLRCPAATTSYADTQRLSPENPGDYAPYPRFSTAYLFDGTPPDIHINEQVANDNDDDLSFGAVSVGSDLSHTFDVLNTGGSTLQISAGGITIEGTDSSVFSVTPTFADIVQGGSETFTVTFTPAALQLYSDATLQIVSNDPDDSPYELTLSGTGIVSADKPDIATIEAAGSTALSSVAFGDVLVDSDSTQYFRIINYGSADLTVTSVEITGTNAADFSDVYTNLPDKSSDNYTIAAGGQKLIQVDFTPTTDGLHTANMTLTSNDPDETTLVVPLTGTGVQPDIVVDIDLDDAEVANPLTYIIGFGNQVADGPGNQYAEYPIEIWNLGASTLTIESISLYEGAHFDITGIGTSDVEIAAGGFAEATVIFDPTIAGSSFTDILTIVSDDFDAPTMQFSLTGQASAAFNTTIASGETYEFTDSDGDTIAIELDKGNDLSAVVTFDGGTANGSDIADIAITGGASSSTFTITVTTASGNGSVAVGDIDINGDGFGLVQIDGSATGLSIEGAVKTVSLLGSLGGFSADGAVSTFITGGLSGTVTADAFKCMTITGDIANATISTDPEYKASAIGTLSVVGDVSDTTITTGSIKTVSVTGSVSNTTITTSGAKSSLGAVTITGDVDNLDIVSGKVKSVSVNGDIDDSSILLDNAKASLRAVNVTGDADLDIDVTGAVKSINVEGNLDGAIETTGLKGSIGAVNVGESLGASLSAVKAIKTINAGSDITSALISIDGTGKGSIGKLISGGDLNVGEIDVDGSIKNLTVGDGSDGDLYGDISAGVAINKVTITGDIFGALAAGGKINTISAGGDLKSEASISTTNGSISKLLISDTIYGDISVNNGTGIVKQVLRPNSFADPDTSLVNSYTDHIDAQLAKIKWID